MDSGAQVPAEAATRQRRGNGLPRRHTVSQRAQVVSRSGLALRDRCRNGDERRQRNCRKACCAQKATGLSRQARQSGPGSKRPKIDMEEARGSAAGQDVDGRTKERVLRSGFGESAEKVVGEAITRRRGRTQKGNGNTYNPECAQAMKEGPGRSARQWTRKPRCVRCVRCVTKVYDTGSFWRDMEWRGGEKRRQRLRFRADGGTSLCSSELGVSELEGEGRDSLVECGRWSNQSGPLFLTG